MRAIVLIAFALVASAQEPLPRKQAQPLRDSATGAAAMAGGSCEQRKTDSDAKSPELMLQRVTPSSGSEVDHKTLLMASIRYTVPDYRNRRYSLTAQFDTNESGVTVDGVSRGGLDVLACGPSGTFSFALPLEHVYRYAGIRRPLRLRFYLLEGAGGTREVIASSEVVEYSEPKAIPPGQK